MQSQIVPSHMSTSNVDFHTMKVTTFVIIAVVQFLCVFIFAYKGFLMAIGPLLFIALVYFTAFSVEKTFYLLAFYVILFEEFYYAKRFSDIPLYYVWPIAMGIYIVLITYWVIYLLRNQLSFRTEPMDILIFIFLFFVILSAFNGYLRGYDGKSWRWDVLPYLFYLSYFIFMFSQLKNKSKTLYDLIFFLSVFVALTMVYALSQLKGAIIFQRVVTQNIHLMQFAIPYAGLTAIYSQSLKSKAICTLLLPIFLLSVIISQQRALLFTAILTLFILFIIFMKVVYKTLKRNTKYLWAIIIIAVVVVPFSIIEVFTKESLFLTFISRFHIFLNPANIIRDTSWQIRWQEIIRVLPQISDNLIFGAGLGATTISRHRLILQITVDNSYVYILWKMGLVGLLSFLSIQYMIIKRCSLVLKRTRIAQEKIFAATVLLNTIGLLLIGFTNASIAHYRFLFIWLALIASVELIARKYD